MSAGCRHCFPDKEGVLSPGRETYLTVLKHGSNAGLLRRLANIETAGRVIPGVTSWCEVCRRVSVISYSLYEYLYRQDVQIPDAGMGSRSFLGDAGGQQHQLSCMGIQEYYSSLCTLMDNFERESGGGGVGGA